MNKTLIKVKGSVIAFALLMTIHGVAADLPPAPTPQDVTPVKSTAIDELTRNMNIDFQVIYGNYRHMLSTISLSQQQKDFVYLITSAFDRSNDFGYTNTSYYDNRIGFTGNYRFSDKTRVLFETELNNSGRGMYLNPVYTREEKDRSTFTIRFVQKPSSTLEWFINPTFIDYSHNLIGVVPDNSPKDKMQKGQIVTGGELVWSSVNRVKFQFDSLVYYYNPRSYPIDYSFSGEIIDDFSLTKHIGLSIGKNFTYNRDTGINKWMIFMPIAGINLKELGAWTFKFLYRYDIDPFKPEKFYFDQKYVQSSLNLAPTLTHQFNIHAEYHKSDNINFIGEARIDKAENYYNFVPVTGNILGVSPIDLWHYYFKGDAVIGLIKEHTLDFIFGYEFNYFQADKNITYKPMHSIKESLKYKGEKWNIEWSNSFTTKVYVSPDTDKNLKLVILGRFDIQREILNGFYAYISIDNLYNQKYNLRDGYPEPGVNVFGGIRVLY